MRTPAPSDHRGPPTGDRLPAPPTRIAMLEGVRDQRHHRRRLHQRRRRMCPMLAAHRNGGRTSFIAFAQAWDRFAFRGARRAPGPPGHRARAAHAQSPTSRRACAGRADLGARSPSTWRSPAPSRARARRSTRPGCATAGTPSAPVGRLESERAPSASSASRAPRDEFDRAPRPDREPAAGRLEDDLGDHAAGGEAQEHPHRLGDVLGAWIMFSAATCSLTKSVIGVSTNAGHSADDLIPSPELLVHGLGEADHAVLVAE